MSFTNIPASLEILIPVLAFLFVSLQKWKAGMRDTWRVEAEAQKLRGDRLAEGIAKLDVEIQALRRENAELRAMLAQSRPERSGLVLPGGIETDGS